VKKEIEDRLVQLDLQDLKESQERKVKREILAHRERKAIVEIKVWTEQQDPKARRVKEVYRDLKDQ